MTTRRIPMRQIRDVLRLHHDLGLSGRQIAHSLGLHHSPVTDLVGRAQRARIPWPLPADWDDGQLDRALYPGNQGRPRGAPSPTGPPSTGISADTKA